MDEYNPRNIDPEKDPANDYDYKTYYAEPEQETPVDRTEYYAYNPVPDPQKPKKPKKKRTGLIIAAAVVLAVAVVAGAVFGSSALFNMFENFNGAPAGDAQSQTDDKKTPAKQEETAVRQEESYTVNIHQLPKQLDSNDTNKSLTPVEVYEQTVNSVVGIRTEATVNAFGHEAVSASSGTGFILSEEGYVITNSHVVSGADTIEVELFNEESYVAELVGEDSNYDIAVLKIDAENLQPVTVGDSDDLKVGEEVAVIGNPLGELTFTMTTGILSALDREINTDGNPQNMLQTNAAINSGNSGGPLFDMNGNVIGVTTAKYSGTSTSGATIEGLGFAIPINTALKVAYDLTDHGYVRDQAYLGVTVKTLDSKTAAYYGLPIGPRVDAVIEGSCAEKAGIQVGDIIIAINGEETATHPELLAVLKKYKAGETVEIKIFRSGAEMTVTATLDEKPREEEADEQAAASKKEPQAIQPQQPQIQPQQPQVIDPFEYFFGGSGNPFGSIFGYGG